jgi:type IV pilus assembly protein PilM
MFLTGRFTSSTGLVGIELGSSPMGVTRMLQLRQRGDELSVIGAAVVDAASGVADDAAGAAGLPGAAAAIEAALAAAGFRGRRCAVCLPPEDLVVQSVRLPTMPDDEMRQAAVWEASQRFKLDPSEMEVHAMRTGAACAGAGGHSGGEGREEVLLIAAPHAAIHSRLQPLLDAGLRPLVVDTSFAAVARVFAQGYRREEDRQHVRALVEVGASCSHVMVLRGNEIAFCKPLPIGGRHFTAAVSDHLKLDAASAAELRASRMERPVHVSDPATDRAVFEAVRPLMGELVKEAMLCLRYYGVTFRGRPPERLILTGSDGLEPKLADLFAQSCKLPVMFDDSGPGGPGSLASLGMQIEVLLQERRCVGSYGGWAAAAGLSLRGLCPAPSRRAAAVSGSAVSGGGAAAPPAATGQLQEAAT